MKVVILSFNHPDLTERTVESVRAHFSDSEILLVHNGSQLQHQTTLTKKFPQMEHLILAQNRGYPGGANAGLRQAFATVEWVLFLTNDCKLIEHQIPPRPGLVAPLIWARKIDRVDSLGGKFLVDSAHLSHCKSIEDFQKADQAYVPGTAFWLHKSVFESLDGFDESLEMFWEDVDFSLRARLAGFEVYVDDATKVLHAIGKTTHKDTRYTTYLFQRNRKRISLKYTKHPWRVYFALARSWASMGFFHLRKKNWDRLKLLRQAIVD